MTDELIFGWLIAITEFFAKLIGSFISTMAVFGTLYVICYIVARYLVCSNNPKEWEWFSEEIKDGIKGYVTAFKESAPGVIQCAKDWTASKVNHV